MGYDQASIQYRTKLLREAFKRAGEGQKEFAIRMGCEPKTWNNFEKHRIQRISLDAAVRVVEKIEGLTLDWIFLNDATTLSFPVRDALEKAAYRLRGESPSADREATTRKAGRLAAGAAGKSPPSKRARA